MRTTKRAVVVAIGALALMAVFLNAQRTDARWAAGVVKRVLSHDVALSSEPRMILSNKIFGAALTAVCFAAPNFNEVSASQPPRDEFSRIVARIQSKQLHDREFVVFLQFDAERFEQHAVPFGSSFLILNKVPNRCFAGGEVLRVTPADRGISLEAPETRATAVQGE